MAPSWEGGMLLAPVRLGGLCALVASAVGIVAFPAFVTFRPETPPPLGLKGAELLQAFPARHLLYWTALHAVNASLLFLCVPVVWAVHLVVRERGARLMDAGTPLGILALVGEGLARLWQATVQADLVRAYNAGGPGASVLLDLADRLARYPDALHLASYLIGAWAVLLLVSVVQERSLPQWLGWLALALVPGLGPAPFALLVWLVPTAWLLLGSPLPAGAPLPTRRSPSP